MRRAIFFLSWCAAASAGDIDSALQRLYNFDFAAAHAHLDRAIAAQTRDPLPQSLKAAAYLFSELHRLQILEGEFFTDDKRIIDKKKLQPDPEIRKLLFAAVDAAQERARAVLNKNPDDPEALFAMCISLGITTDYMALVEKRQIRSLSIAKASNTYAQRLLRADPKYYDAYLTTGINEYLVGSLPFFVRWFVRFDNVKGSKEQGIDNLELVARRGRYLRPFAKILLAVVYLREKRPENALAELNGFAREYPENPLVRKEIARLMTGDR